MTVRTKDQRRSDTLSLLRTEEDLWIATVNRDGSAHLIPLSFSWNGSKLLLATPERSRTVRNLRRMPTARVAIGPTRDVVIVEGAFEVTSPSSDDELAEFHASRVGFDARNMSEPWVFIAIAPERIEAWRNPEELPGREIFGDGSWMK